ncbi:MAG: hypothetical protein HGN29_15460 [Asgard group archaeon]|nr:hypothetical protein [Asgard group archaeon]
MKILLISYFFPPSTSVGGLRAYSFAKYFPEEGIEVVVLTSESELKDNKNLQKEYGLDEIYYGKKTKLREWGYKTKILALLEMFKLDKIFFFPDVYFGWIKSAIKMGSKAINEQNPDYIVVTAPPFSSFLIAEKLSTKFDIPLILDYRDPWNGNPTIEFPFKFVQKKYKKKEKQIAQRASLVVTVGEEYSKLISEITSINPNEFKIINNGFFAEKLSAESFSKEDKKFVITLVGSFYLFYKDTFNEMMSGLKEFVETMKLKPDQVEFRYAGSTSRKIINRAVQQAEVSEYFNDLVYLKGDEYFEFLQNSHLLVLMVPQKHKYAIATKLYDYLNSDSHVLIVGYKGEATKICDDVDQIYDVVNPISKEIGRKFSSLYELWKKNELKYGCNIDKLQKYERRNLAKEFAKHLIELRE